MNPHDYQRGALRTEAPITELTLNHLQVRLLHAAMGACTEAGELQDQLKRHLFYGAEIDLTNIVEEWGDLFWYAAIGLDACGVSFYEAMQRNNAKLRARYPEKFTEHDAVHRNLEQERRRLEGPTFVYIAHPLRGNGSDEWGDKQRNFERYLKLVALATNTGYVVMSWAHYELTHGRGLTKGGGDFYLPFDFKILSRSDELWLGGPVGVSEGTRQELVVAFDLGIPVKVMEPNEDFTNFSLSREMTRGDFGPLLSL